MRFGPKCPLGFLPIFSVNTEDEAKALLLLACPTTYDGAYFAPELRTEQTLPNLYAFGDRLRDIYVNRMGRPNVAPSNAKPRKRKR